MRTYFLLFIGCVLFHILGTWNLPLIDRDEPRFAEASREMREKGDYIVPYFNGQYRFDKPPFTYWKQVGSYRLFGENDFAARFPSVIAAALTALVIFAWGSRMNPTQTAGGAPALQRLSGSGTGLWGAIMFSLCLQTFIHAKAAVADMWLVLFMTMAHWSGWEMLFGEERSKRRTPNAERRTPNWEWWWWTFYISLALAFLAKGPIGWIPLIPVIWFVVRNRDSDAARRFAFGRGLLLTIFIVCLWGVPALIRTNGEFLRVGIGRHVIGRSLGAMEGHGASSFLVYVLLLPFYFVFVFVSFFPWSFKLPRLFKNLRKDRDSTDSYLLFGIFSIFGIFTLVATKLPHYALPAFPLLALLLARHWMDSTIAQSEWPNPRRQSVFTGIAVGTACLWVAIALVLPPMVARYFPAYALFQKSRDFIRPDTEFGAVDYVEPSLVWYFRSRTRAFMKPLRRKNLAEFMAQPGSRFVVVPTSIAASAVTNSTGKLKIFSTHGFNVPKGQNVDLTLVLKPE